MGGDIGVESTLGQGSRFWFTAHLPHRPHPSDASTYNTTWLQGRRALYIDSSDSQRQALQSQLMAWGIHVDVETSGRQGLERLRAMTSHQCDYDLILLDAHLSDIDGLTWIRQLSSDSTIAAIPAILLSASPPRDEGSAFQEAGAAASLNRPFRTSQLLRCLSNVLRSCFKIIRIGFSMRYVPYKVPICGGNQNSQTRITPGFGDVAAPVQTGSDALHVVT